VCDSGAMASLRRRAVRAIAATPGGKNDKTNPAPAPGTREPVTKRTATRRRRNRDDHKTDFGVRRGNQGKRVE